MCVRVRKQTADGRGTGSDISLFTGTSVRLLCHRIGCCCNSRSLSSSSDLQPQNTLHDDDDDDRRRQHRAAAKKTSLSLRVMRPMPENVTQRKREEKRRTTTSGPLVRILSMRNTHTAFSQHCAHLLHAVAAVVRQTDRLQNSLFPPKGMTRPMIAAHVHDRRRAITAHADCTFPADTISFVDNFFFPCSSSSSKCR